MLLHMHMKLVIEKLSKVLSKILKCLFVKMGPENVPKIKCACCTEVFVCQFHVGITNMIEKSGSVCWSAVRDAGNTSIAKYLDLAHYIFYSGSMGTLTNRFSTNLKGRWKSDKEQQSIDVLVASYPMSISLDKPCLNACRCKILLIFKPNC